MLLASRPAERADRHGILKPHAAAGLQRKTATPAADIGEFQLNATVPGPGGRGSDRPHQSHPKTR